MEVFRFATDPAQVGPWYREMLQILPNPSFNRLVSSNGAPLLAWVSEVVSLGRARPSIPDYVKVSRQLQAMFEKTFSDPMPVEALVRRTAEFIAVISKPLPLPEGARSRKEGCLEEKAMTQPQTNPILNSSIPTIQIKSDRRKAK